MLQLRHLAAGYTSALIARDAFEKACAEAGVRGIHLSCPHPPHEARAVAARVLASEPECTAAITTGGQFSAAEMLIERLRDSAAPPQQLLIGGDLTVRESTGSAPARWAGSNRSRNAAA